MPKRKTVLDNKNLFSPVDIEKWFGISRTTLFRWENENRIPEPSKDKNGARMYERRHLIRIAEVEKDRMKRELERRVREDENAELITSDFQERLHKIRLFTSDEPSSSITHLKCLGVLSPETERLLFEVASSRERGDPVRKQILEALIENEEHTLTE